MTAEGQQQTQTRNGERERKYIFFDATFILVEGDIAPGFSNLHPTPVHPSEWLLQNVTVVLFWKQDNY